MLSVALFNRPSLVCPFDIERCRPYPSDYRLDLLWLAPVVLSQLVSHPLLARLESVCRNGDRLTVRDQVSVETTTGRSVDIRLSILCNPLVLPLDDEDSSETRQM